MEIKQRRVAVFVDGFNLYHSLTYYDRRTKSFPYKKYRWLDLRALAESFVRKTDAIENIYYFTALYPGNPNNQKTDEEMIKVSQAQSRHLLYINALNSMGVTPIIGNFQAKDRWCPQCKQYFKSCEEKLTDVNIASYLLKSCSLNKHDVAIVVTGDNDLKPAFEIAKELCPAKEIRIVLPIASKSKKIKAWAFQHRVVVHSIRENHLSEAQLPREVVGLHGNYLKPDYWY